MNMLLLSLERANLSSNWWYMDDGLLRGSDQVLTRCGNSGARRTSQKPVFESIQMQVLSKSQKPSVLPTTQHVNWSEGVVVLGSRVGSHHFEKLFIETFLHSFSDALSSHSYHVLTQPMERQLLAWL